MSVAHSHVGPWTLTDVLALPENPAGHSGALGPRRRLEGWRPG